LCEELINLATFYHVALHSEEETDQSSLVETLARTLISLIKAHPIVEKAENSQPDQVLIGK
jgi:hypothetical protein